VGNKALFITPCRRSHLFNLPQYASTALVLTPVVGSTKFSQWLTVGQTSGGGRANSTAAVLGGRANGTITMAMHQQLLTG